MSDPTGEPGPGAARDQRAEAAVLLAQHGRALRALARQLVAPEDVDDVVQDTLLASLGTTAERRGAWLRGAMQNLAALLRRSARRRRARETEAALRRRVHSDDPGLLAAQAELAVDIAAAVNALDEPFRAAVVLRFWHGHPVAAIAQQLGVPANTVRSRLQRALERLRARLDARHGSRAAWSGPLATLVAGTGVTLQTKVLAGAAAVLVAVGVVLPFTVADRTVEPPPAGPTAVATVVAPTTDERAAPESRSDAGAFEGEAAVCGDYVVHAFDRETGAAIAAAEVVGVVQALPEGGDEVARHVAWSKLARRLATTGSDGTAAVRATRGSPLRVACGDRCGFAYANANGSAPQQPIEVALAPDRGIELTAVDAVGRPVADLPIGVRSLHGFDGRYLCGAQLVGVTDHDGRLAMRPHACMVAPPDTVQFVVYAPGVWMQPGPTVEPAADRAVEVRYVVPPLGALRCEYATAIAPECLGAVAFSLTEPGERRAGTAADPDFGGWQWSAVAAAFAHTWPYVGVGTQFEVECRPQAGIAVTVRGGPQRAGETATLRADEPADTCVVLGRVLDGAGAPIASREVSVRIAAGRTHGGAPKQVLGDGGRFRCPFRIDPDGMRLDTVFVTTDVDGIGDSPPRGALREPNEPMRPGALDLGDLRLGELPLLCSGRVVAPRIDERVGLRVEIDRSGHAGTADPGSRAEWNWDARADTTVVWRRAAEGAFAAYGQVDGALRVVADANNAPRATCAFASGAQGLELQLQRGGSIRGRIDAVPAGAVALTLTEERVGARPAWRDSQRSDFEWVNVRPGSYTVRAFVLGDAEPLATVAGVRVTAGEDTDDPRLRPLRCEGALREVVVEAVCADGTNAQGQVLVDGAADHVGSFLLERGRAVVWTRHPAVDLYVCAEGHVPARVHAVTPFVRVALERPRTVTVRFPADVVPAGYALVWRWRRVRLDGRPSRGVFVGPAGLDQWFGDGREIAFDAAGVATVPVFDDAPARLECHVQRRPDYGYDKYAIAVPVSPSPLPLQDPVIDLLVLRTDVEAAIARLPASPR